MTHSINYEEPQVTEGYILKNLCTDTLEPLWEYIVYDLSWEEVERFEATPEDAIDRARDRKWKSVSGMEMWRNKHNGGKL